MVMYICDRKCQHTSQNMTVPSSDVIHNLLLHTPPTYPCRKEDGVMCGQGEVAVLVCLVDVLLSLQVHCLQLLEHLLVYPAETSVLNREKVRWSVLSKGWGMVCKCVCGWVWSVCPHRKSDRVIPRCIQTKATPTCRRLQWSSWRCGVGCRPGTVWPPASLPSLGGDQIWKRKGRRKELQVTMVTCMLWEKGGWEKVAMVMSYMCDRKLHEQLILHTRQQKRDLAHFIKISRYRSIKVRN